jgi:2-polyprenyl-6-methoxyphenol hydroxylase-like FAD-dependent oxidoreductase
MNKPIIIIGGGIGGLTAALALQKIGVEVRVFERAPELKEVGAGLGLWLNAVLALDRLGVGEKIRSLASPLKFGELATPQGKVLSRMDIEKIIGVKDTGNFVMHRADLLSAVKDALPPGIIETDAECEKIEQDGGGVTAYFKNGKSVRGSLLIGADGLHSVVRKHLWGDSQLRYSGQTCYRGTAGIAAPEANLIREIQGAGKRGAVCPISEKRIYWWAALNAPRGEIDEPNKRREFLLKAFKGWGFGLPEMIAATESEILRNDLVDRQPLPKWSRGRVSLLGDAAHPMLPNLGQGACTAIEDGFILSRNVAESGLNEEALKNYERARIPRTTKIVKQSWNFGIPVKWESFLAVWFREKLMTSLPESVTYNLMRDNVCYDVGKLPEQKAHSDFE